MVGFLFFGMAAGVAPTGQPLMGALLLALFVAFGLFVLGGVLGISAVLGAFGGVLGGKAASEL